MIHTNRRRNVLQRLFATVDAIEIQLATQLLLDFRRQADAANMSQRLEPGRDVDTVAEQVVAVDHDVAEIDANAKRDLAVRRDAGIAITHAFLHACRAAHGIDHAAEFDEKTVSHRLDDATAMLSDQRVDQLLAVRFQCNKSAALIVAHQAAIAGNVGRNDRCQASLLAGHAHPPVLLLTLRV